MEPVERIVAVCQGGPLDGLRFSVARGEGASPPPIDNGGHFYVADIELSLAKEHEKSLTAQREGEEPHPVFEGFVLHDPEDGSGGVLGHNFTGVWRYKPGTRKKAKP